MDSKTQIKETPQNVAQTATQSGALPTRGTVLLGIFGSPLAPEALVRTGGGHVKRVKSGSRLASSVVVGIDENGLLLQRGGKTQRLEIPGG